MKRRSFIKGVGFGAAGISAIPVRADTRSIPELRDRLNSCSGDNSFWEVIRDQFLFPEGYRYFNTGGIGAVPAVVLNHVKSHLDKSQIHPGPGHDHKLWEDIKKKAAIIFGSRCTADELALTSTATEGINIVVNGLPLKAGDEIITSTHEHPALNIALLNRKERDGIAIKTFTPDFKDGPANAGRIKKLITTKTRLVFISHITCTTGQRFPESEICALARKRGFWTAFDGAQVVGAMPIDVSACGVDFYAISGHKWLLGPKRTGILYVKKELQEFLRPVTAGAYSDNGHDILKQELEFQNSAQRYEYATQNDSLFFGLYHAIDFINTIGIERIWKHNRCLAEAFYEGLAAMNEIVNLSPSQPQYRTSMISFNHKRKPCRDIAAALSKKQFRVRVVPEAGLEGIRVSMHVYNTLDEITELLTAIRDITG